MKSIFPLTAGASLNVELHESRNEGNGNRWEINEVIHLFILLVFLLIICSCGQLLLDGPFNKNGEMVSPLLYANNGTNLVTFWDEDLRTYRTYDQEKNYFLNKAIFTTEQNNGSGRKDNFIIVGGAVVSQTQLDSHGLQIQEEKGCIACHIK